MFDFVVKCVGVVFEGVDDVGYCFVEDYVDYFVKDGVVEFKVDKEIDFVVFGCVCEVLIVF